jgi:hypothetical protein
VKKKIEEKDLHLKYCSTGRRGGIVFEKIIGSEEQIAILFDLLQKRAFNISNKEMPTVSQHTEFVRDNPYRIWYLIKINMTYSGSIYLTGNNCIGVNMVHHRYCVKEILSAVCKKHQPLCEVKSLTPPYFHVNIPTNDVEMHQSMQELGAEKIQCTYRLNMRLL